ncbi:flagellar biosynthesis protein [Dyella sp.]|jgi:flagellar biosynthesis protein|uniref:flagellar biosynthesis protein n=1 Tax=Dyella sp. TaxID=1869338 RepID=UPI002D769084|nr:flagellar biosynthesis protein [Dyella sp.]HET6431099.1 flagellar biosynthesis protein [Dyella sp.]
MTQNLPSPQRRVTLKLTSGSGDAPASSPRAPAEAVDLLFARARDQGIPLHPDTQIASLLAALRLRDDVPGTLYAAAASVLACVYEASGEKL